MLVPPLCNIPNWGFSPPYSFYYVLLRMGQRHNRRRTRPRSSHRSSLNQDIPGSPVNQSVSSPSGSPLLASSSIWSSTTVIEPSSPLCISRGSPGPAPAPTWHYGCTAWQIRDATSRLDQGFEAEQYRLFGGEPGDDVTLCYRMLEYFGGLDYIDS